MVVGVSLNVAERADWGVSADATIGMNGKMHDTTARAFAARLHSGFAYDNSAKRASHQTYAEIGDEPDSIMPQFFHCSVDPRKIVVPRPGGGDLP
jgi:hypothetical protein